MTEGDPVIRSGSIVDRAKAIILKPKEEWPVIAGEPTTVGQLFTGYAMILAAIPAICGFIGGQVFGYGAFGFSFKPSLVGSISSAIAQYVFSLLGIFVLAIIINYLAPNFGGTRDKVQAMKVAVYSATAGWLAGVFSLVPSLAILGLVGLYSLYLLYTGLPLLMKTPADKAMTYTVVTIVAAIVIFLVIGLLTMPFRTMFDPAIGTVAEGTAGGTVTVPGMGTVDLDKLNSASKKMEAAAQQMETAAKTGESGAIAPAVLQAMLPASIPGYNRTEVSSEGLGAGGSHARAQYEKGDHGFSIEITDMAAMGALAGMGAAMGVQSNRETATGYEKTSTIDGRIQTESWDRQSGDGKFGTTIGNRFMVEASGRAAGIGELKAAVAAVGLDKLAAMAK